MIPPGVQDAFPIKRSLAYLNNASIGPPSTRVTAAVDAFMADVQHNGRVHYPDWCRTADTVFKSNIARLIGARRGEIAFVKNTTEGILLVANGIDWRPGDNVVVARQEYASNVYCWMNLARQGVEIHWVPLDEGRITPEAIARCIDARTRLVSISAVQFWNGFRADLPAIGRLCRSRGVLLNVDAIQQVGALALDVADLEIDFLAAGGHKWLLAPIGSGFFYCREAALDTLWPRNVGYHSVDKSEDHLDYDLTLRPDAGRFEEALVNFPGLWGLNAAVEQLLELGMDAVQDHILALTAQAIEGLQALGCDIVSPRAPQERSGVLAFSHPRLASEALAERLAAEGVQVALRAGNLRISPSFYNDASEIDRLLATIRSAR